MLLLIKLFLTLSPIKLILHLKLPLLPVNQKKLFETCGIFLCEQCFRDIWFGRTDKVLGVFFFTLVLCGMYVNGYLLTSVCYPLFENECCPSGKIFAQCDINKSDVSVTGNYYWCSGNDLHYYCTVSLTCKDVWTNSQQFLKLTCCIFLLNPFQNFFLFLFNKCLKEWKPCKFWKKK